MSDLTHEPAMDASVRPASDQVTPRVMFAVSMGYLFALALLLHRITREGVPLLELQVWAWIVGGLWLFMLCEDVVRLIQGIRSGKVKQSLTLFSVVALIPPARIGIRGDNGQLWLPKLGWLTVDRDLRKQLEKIFGVPMIVVALLSLPIIAIEFFLAHWLEWHPWLGVILDILLSVIWALFTIEFIIMISVADKKFSYALQHWIDLAIILLPIIQALPFLRALRLGGLVRLDQLHRMNQMYRLRRLAAKLWRALLLLNLIERILGHRIYARKIRKLEEEYHRKLEELEEIKQKLDEWKAKQAAYLAAKAALELQAQSAMQSIETMQNPTQTEGLPHLPVDSTESRSA